MNDICGHHCHFERLVRTYKECTAGLNKLLWGSVRNLSKDIVTVCVEGIKWNYEGVSIKDFNWNCEEELYREVWWLLTHYERVCLSVTFLLILPSPKVFTPDDPPRPSRPKAGLGLVRIMMRMMSFTRHSSVRQWWPCWIQRWILRTSGFHRLRGSAWSALGQIVKLGKRNKQIFLYVFMRGSVRCQRSRF